MQSPSSVRSPDGLPQYYGLTRPAGDKMQVLTIPVVVAPAAAAAPDATATTTATATATAIGAATGIAASTVNASATSSSIATGGRRAEGKVVWVRVCGGEVVGFVDEQALPSVPAGGSGSGDGGGGSGGDGGDRGEVQEAEGGDPSSAWIWSSAGSIGGMVGATWRRWLGGGMFISAYISGKRITHIMSFFSCPCFSFLLYASYFYSTSTAPGLLYLGEKMGC